MLDTRRIRLWFEADPEARTVSLGHNEIGIGADHVRKRRVAEHLRRKARVRSLKVLPQRPEPNAAVGRVGREQGYRINQGLWPTFRNRFRGRSCEVRSERHSPRRSCRTGLTPTCSSGERKQLCSTFGGAKKLFALTRMFGLAECPRCPCTFASHKRWTTYASTILALTRARNCAAAGGVLPCRLPLGRETLVTRQSPCAAQTSVTSMFLNLRVSADRHCPQR